MHTVAKIIHQSSLPILLNNTALQYILPVKTRTAITINVIPVINSLGPRFSSSPKLALSSNVCISIDYHTEPRFRNKWSSDYKILRLLRLILLVYMASLGLHVSKAGVGVGVGVGVLEIFADTSASAARLHQMPTRHYSV